MNARSDLQGGCEAVGLQVLVLHAAGAVDHDVEVTHLQQFTEAHRHLTPPPLTFWDEEDTHHAEPDLSMTLHDPGGREKQRLTTMNCGWGVSGVSAATHLLLLLWNRISSTVALSDPDSSSFSTSLWNNNICITSFSSGGFTASFQSAHHVRS